jgi:flavin reductase (DIM6/NTAB) family NADH-FMN oxidoreductase RutF
VQIKVDYARAAERRYPEQVVIALAKDKSDKVDPIAIGWTTPISREPPMMALAVAPGRYFLGAVRESRGFVVVYPSAAMAMETKFFGTRSGHDLDKLTECPIRTQPAHEIEGVIARDAVANFECTLEAEHEAGDHIVLFGRVVATHVNEDSSLERLFTIGKGYQLGGVTSSPVEG